MNLSRPAIAICLTLTLLLAGCASPGGSPGETAGELTLASGSQASAPLTFEDVDAAPEEAQLSITDDDGLDVQEPGALLAGDNGTLNAWLTVAAPEDAETGDHQVAVALEGPDGQSQDAVVDVEITQPDETLAEGQIAMLHLTARTPEGTVAFTTDQNVSESHFPKTESFQAPQRPGPTQVPLQQQAQLPGDLLEQLIGAGVGQDLSAEIPEAFGPETIEQPQERQETVERSQEQQRSTEVPRQIAEQQQLIDSSTQEGDELEIPGTPLPYVVDHLNETAVVLALDVEENETYTLHEPWPDGTEVTEVNQTTVTLYTTPTHEPGERFTWNPDWPEATEIVELTDDQIVLEHSPEVGTTYTQQGQQGQMVELTVAELTEEEIIVHQNNPHPLAGQTMTFEIHVDGVQEAPQGGMGQPGQPSPR